MPIHRAALARLCANAAIVALAGVAALCAFAEFHWAFDLLTHFRAQLAVLAAVATVFAAALRMWTSAALGAAILGVQMAALAPYVLATAPEPPAGDAAGLRIVVANVFTGNRNHEAVRTLIASTQPDIVCLLEVDHRWINALAGLRAGFPYGPSVPRNDNFGVAVFSRIPLEGIEIRELAHAAIPFVLGHLTLGSKPTTLAFAHPVPPASPGGSALRNLQLDLLSRARQEFADREFVLLGDLNTTPWSPHYRTLEASTGLRNASIGFGLNVTWPTALPWLMIPIDHVLASAGLAVTRYETSEAIGSDHLPVVVEIQAPRGRRPPVPTRLP